MKWMFDLPSYVLGMLVMGLFFTTLHLFKM